jgi:hypothetical protein
MATYTDPQELLARFEKELANQGTWYWTDKNGTRARILTAMQKMLKAGMSDADVKEIIIDLQFAGYVEHERQVKFKTGLSVREFIQKNYTSPTPLNSQETKIDEHICSSIGQS